MKKLLLLLFIIIISSYKVWAQTNPAAQSLPLSQNFDSMGSAGTVLPNGFAAWLNGYQSSKALAEASTPASNAVITARTTTTTSGGVYNYYSGAGSN